MLHSIATGCKLLYAAEGCTSQIREVQLAVCYTASLPMASYCTLLRGVQAKIIRCKLLYATQLGLVYCPLRRGVQTNLSRCKRLYATWHRYGG